MIHSRSSADKTKVHADASVFAEGVTKEDAYQQVLLQAEGLFAGQRNWVRCKSYWTIDRDR